MTTIWITMQQMGVDVDHAALPAEAQRRHLADLLGRVSRSDAAAFHDLYRLAAPNLFGLAVRITRKHEWAEDVLQDSFVKIWRFADAYDPLRSPAMAWMSTIVRNQAFDLLRQSRYTEELCDGFEFDCDVAAERAASDGALQLSLDAVRLTSCLQQLNPMQRQAIALAYFRGQSHAEIATTLAVPAGTVKSWIRRGLVFLRRRLEGGEVEADAEEVAFAA
jgi:RNA polymerase sigma factor (sigma-70 family)